MRVTGITACLLVLLLAGVVRADDGPQIKITAEAKVAALTSEDTPKLHWILTPLPSAADVQVADESVRQLVNDAIEQIRSDSSTGCLQWVLELRSKCNLPAELKKRLAAIQFVPKGTLNPPTQAGQTPPLVLRFGFTKPSFEKMASLSVEISTESFDKTASDAADGSPLKTTWDKAAATLEQPLPPGARGDIPITIHFTAEDLARPKLDAFPATRIEKALLRVAVVSLEKAHANACVPGSPIPPAIALDRVITGIEKSFTVPAPGWPRPKVQFRVVEGTADYLLSVRTLRIASSAEIHIVRGQIQGKSRMVDFEGATPAREKKIQNSLIETQRQVTGRLAADLGRVEGAAPAADNVSKVRERLGTDPSVSGIGDLTAANSALVFEGKRRWTLGALNAKTNVAGSFTPEDFLTGQAELDGNSLIRNIVRRDLGETYNLSVQGGNEVQRANLDFAVPRTHGTDWVWSYGFRLNAFYSRDWNQRFGNVAPADPKLIDRDKGLAPKLYVELRRNPADGFPWTVVTRVETFYDWRAVLVEPRAEGTTALIDGQLSAPTLQVTQVVGRELNGPVGSVRVAFQGAARRGTGALAGDFRFEQFTASAKID